MYRIYKLSFLVLLLPLISYSQTNFKPGYVVSLKGDTLRGNIDFREWGKNPRQIAFKKDLNKNDIIIFSDKNTKAFSVAGLEYFERLISHISQDQVEMSNIKQGADTSYIIDTVFMRVLTKGPNITLFSYTDNIKTRYYLLEREKEYPEELIYRVYYSLENHSDLVTENRYQSQLDHLALKYNLNNNKFETQISSCSYTETDLVKVAQVINGNTDKQFTPVRNSGSRWLLGAGVNSSVMSFEGVLKFTGQNSTYPKISAGFDLFPNKNTQQLFLRVELSLTAAKYSFYNPNPDGYSQSLELSQRTGSIIPQLIYNIYNQDRFKIFIDAAASVNVSSYNNYKLVENFNNVAESSSPGFPGLARFWYTFYAKTGVVLNKKWEIYVSYAPSAIVTANYDTFAGTVVSYQAGLNYLFGIK